ncbi:MAG: type II toxin-antitoxin system RelE/ParE family toxin [Chloroflexota bacterium]
MRVEFSGPALADLIAITDHIALDNPFAADRVKDRLFAATDVLVDQPGIGRPGRVGRTRELVLRPYVIAYHVRSQTVEVLAVIDTRRGNVEEIIVGRLPDTPQDS